MGTLANEISNNRSSIFTDKNKIGEGSFSVVYRYKNYAVKVYKYHSKPTDKIIVSNSDFVNLKRLRNIGITNIPEPVDNHIDFTVTRFIEGTMLFNLANTQNKQKFTLHSTWKEQIFKTLDICAKNRILPFDVDAQNILITPLGKPYIIDVGSFMFDLDPQGYELTKDYPEDKANLARELTIIDNFLRRRLSK